MRWQYWHVKDGWGLGADGLERKFSVFTGNENNQSAVRKEGHVPQKQIPLGNRTPWWRTRVDMRKAV